MSDNTNNTPRPSQCLWCKEGKSVGRIPPAHDCPDAPAVQQAPAPYAQRPTLEIAEAKLRDLLSSALAMGYATGSVGCSYEGTDDTFAYEVKYRITRRDAENGHGQGEAAAAGGLRGRDMGAVRAEQGRGMEGADQGTADLDDGAAVAQAAQQAPVLGAAQDDVLRLWRALERIEDEVTAERTGKIVPLAALAGISAILDEAKHGAPAAPPAPLPVVDPLREAARQGCPGGSEYGHGMSRTVVHAGGCCERWAAQQGMAPQADGITVAEILKYCQSQRHSPDTILSQCCCGTCKVANLIKCAQKDAARKAAVQRRTTEEP